MNDDFNGFGASPNLVAFYELAREIGWSLMDQDYQDAGDVLSDAARRLQIAQATGRWRHHGKSQSSRATHPPSISSPRSAFRSNDASSGSRNPPVSLVTSVPASAAQQAEYIRDAVAQPDGGGRIESPAHVHFDALQIISERPEECLLEGVLLTARPDGQLDDGVAWLVRTPGSQVVELRSTILGRIREAGWANVVHLLAAIISWGVWTAPEPLAIDLDGDRAARRSIRKGRLKRLEEAGGLAGVLILDAKRRPAPPSSPPVGTHASPIPHVRSGHFKRVPVGPREEQRREIRWIAPTMVNPTGAGSDMIRVYRLPSPPMRNSGVSKVWIATWEVSHAPDCSWVGELSAPITPGARFASLLRTQRSEPYLVGVGGDRVGVPVRVVSQHGWGRRRDGLDHGLRHPRSRVRVLSI